MPQVCRDPGPREQGSAAGSTHIMRGVVNMPPISLGPPLLPQLRHEYHMSQEEVTRLQKEALQLKERMEKKNEKIVQLNSDIDVLRESLAKRWGARGHAVALSLVVLLQWEGAG